MGLGLILVLQYIYQPHYAEKKVYPHTTESLRFYYLICVSLQKSGGREESFQETSNPFLNGEKAKGPEDPQNTTFHALMNCSSTQKADTSKSFFKISLIWPCYPPIWSAASVYSLNIFLTPFSSKGRWYSKVSFPIQMGCMVCITPLTAFSYI